MTFSIAAAHLRNGAFRPPVQPWKANILDGYDKMLEGYDKAAPARLAEREEDYDSQVFRAQHAFEQQHDSEDGNESPCPRRPRPSVPTGKPASTAFLLD
jgi:hypothetical protein